MTVSYIVYIEVQQTAWHLKQLQWCCVWHPRIEFLPKYLNKSLVVCNIYTQQIMLTKCHGGVLAHFLKRLYRWN